MAKTTSFSSKVAACVLYVVNFVVMVTCVLMLAFGLWIITSPSSLYSVVNASGSATLKNEQNYSLKTKSSLVDNLNKLTTDGPRSASRDPPGMTPVPPQLLAGVMEEQGRFVYFRAKKVFLTIFGLIRKTITSDKDVIKGLNIWKNMTDTILFSQALVQDMLTLRVGIAVTAVAAFIFFVCFMGFYGAISKSPFLLFMYAALVFLLLLLECALLYYFSSNFVEKGLQDDGQWTHAMRIIFKCCEYNTSLPMEIKLPWSCCGPEWYPNNCTATFTYKKDCRTSIHEWFSRYQLAIYSSLAVLHITLASCSIIRRSCSHSHSYS